MPDKPTTGSAAGRTANDRLKAYAKSSRIRRRTILGAATVTVAGAPLVVLASAEAQPAPTAAAPPHAAPKVIDPAFELGPAEPQLPPWARPRLPGSEARRLRARDRSLPGQGERMSAGLASSNIPFTFAVNRFDIREVPDEIAPYFRTTPMSLTDTGRHDASGVRMFLRDGRLYNHPVAQSQYGLALLESYRITEKKEYLDRARAQAQRLWDTRVLRADAWFFPYRFSFQLHGSTETYRPPWYSMMAQGQALSLFSRLHKVTGEDKWATAARNTFRSYLLPPAVGQPWGVYVIGGRLVLEEYPDPTRIHGDCAYNGHNFSAFGLHDYWSLTKDADALTLLQGAMTTTRDWAAGYRVSGWRSKYCLSHAFDSGHYHDIHMSQFAHLYAFSGDSVFAQLADTYYSDFGPGRVSGTVRLAAGGHTGCKFDSAGRVTARKTLRLNQASSAPSVDREKVWRQPGFWYSVNAGGLAGFKVQEKPPTRFQVGTYAGLGYLVNRSARIEAATKAFSVNGAGVVTAVATTFAVGDVVTVDARAVLNASEHVRLAEGEHVGKWLPLARVSFV